MSIAPDLTALIDALGNMRAVGQPDWQTHWSVHAVINEARHYVDAVARESVSDALPQPARPRLTLDPLSQPCRQKLTLVDPGPDISPPQEPERA